MQKLLSTKYQATTSYRDEASRLLGGFLDIGKKLSGLTNTLTTLPQACSGLTRGETIDAYTPSFVGKRRCLTPPLAPCVRLFYTYRSRGAVPQNKHAAWNIITFLVSCMGGGHWLKLQFSDYCSCPALLHMADVYMNRELYVSNKKIYKICFVGVVMNKSRNADFVVYSAQYLVVSITHTVFKFTEMGCN